MFKKALNGFKNLFKVEDIQQRQAKGVENCSFCVGCNFNIMGEVAKKQFGSFQWVRADRTVEEKTLNIGQYFKCLIPSEFGGGFIRGCYQGYGQVGLQEDDPYKYDMYELVAFWNIAILTRPEWLKYDGDQIPKLKAIDLYTESNRLLGVQLVAKKDMAEKLRYPLKLVSDSYTGTYEDIDLFSYMVA